jgi:putative solute:sodium symporter small subunit
MARAHRRYWRFNVALIGVLMTIGLVVSFGVPLFADHLQRVRVAGFPLPFYMGAQGAMQIADARLLRAARDAA